MDNYNSLVKFGFKALGVVTATFVLGAGSLWGLDTVFSPVTDKMNDAKDSNRCVQMVQRETNVGSNEISVRGDGEDKFIVTVNDSFSKDSEILVYECVVSKRGTSFELVEK